MTQQTLISVWANELGKVYYWSEVPYNPEGFNAAVYDFLRNPEYDQDWLDGTILWDEQTKRWVYDGMTLYSSRAEAEAHK